MGRPLDLPDEAPKDEDLERADELAQTSELLDALWNADESDVGQSGSEV